jgi:hypothetical protein
MPKKKRRDDAAIRSLRGVRMMIEEVRRNFSQDLAPMPDRPLVREQEKMAQKSGTPAQFADKVTQAIGEISIDEARTAIRKYLKEWNSLAQFKGKAKSNEEAVRMAEAKFGKKSTSRSDGTLYRFQKSSVMKFRWISKPEMIHAPGLPTVTLPGEFLFEPA